jgi:hypothetical protein
MPQHAADQSFRRAQPLALERLEDVAALDAMMAAAQDYCSLLAPTDISDCDDSAYLQSAFPSVESQCQLIANLGARMLDWNVPSATAPQQAIDNKTAPSGYTYLGQFIAHDLSFAGERFPHIGGALSQEAQDNLRETPLSLETIYGGGPHYYPLAYVCPAGRADAKPGQLERIQLRLGRTQAAGGAQAPDLPRLICPELARLDGATAPRGATDVLIPDSRNDEHALISQLTTLFMRAHNQIAAAVLQDAKGCATQTEFDYAFRRARAANVHLFRTIVWNDYLRRMLNPAVFARYAPRRQAPDNRVQFVTSGSIERMPVEFSHAAFRFGHAMIRASYKLGGALPFDIEQILLRSSAMRPDLMPYDHNWLIDWRKFFGGKDGDSPDAFVFSRPLTPSVTVLPTSATFVIVDVLGEEKTLDIAVQKCGRKTDANGLATRDLARAYSAPVASVADILTIMRRDPTLRALVDASPLLADAPTRAKAIEDWLNAPGLCGAEKDVVFSESEIAFLKARPPLFFFVLFEAERLGGGVRLGPLGSFILAEVLFPRLLAKAGMSRFEAGETYSSQELITPPAQIAQDLAAAFARGAPMSMMELIDALED